MAEAFAVRRNVGRGAGGGGVLFSGEDIYLSVVLKVVSAPLPSAAAIRSPFSHSGKVTQGAAVRGQRALACVRVCMDHSH